MVSGPQVDGPVAVYQVRDPLGTDGVRLVNQGLAPAHFDAVFAAPSQPTLAPLDRGEGWVVLLPAGAEVAVDQLKRALPILPPRSLPATLDRSRGELDRAPPRAAVVLSAEALRGLSPEQRSAAAGLTSLPLQVLDGLAAAGLPLVLEVHRRGASARAAAERLGRQTGLPVQAAYGGNLMALAGALALFSAAAASLLGALTFVALGLGSLGLLAALVALALGALAGRAAWGWGHEQTRLSDVRQALDEAEEERARRQADPRLARAWAQLAHTRVALAEGQLPATAASDLRGVLTAAEQELDELGARALRGQPVEAEARRLEEVLRTLEGAVGRWRDAHEESALDAIAEATRRARQREPA